jgi:hypothetical protein
MKTKILITTTLILLLLSLNIILAEEEIYEEDQKDFAQKVIRWTRGETTFSEIIQRVKNVKFQKQNFLTKIKCKSKQLFNGKECINLQEIGEITQNIVEEKLQIPSQNKINIDFKHQDSGVNQVTKDSEGNTYVTGFFSRQAQFGDIIVETWEETKQTEKEEAQAQFKKYKMPSFLASQDAFIGKINSQGEWEWVKTIGSNRRRMNDAFGLLLPGVVKPEGIQIGEDNNLEVLINSNHNSFFSNSEIQKIGESPLLVKVTKEGNWLEAKNLLNTKNLDLKESENKIVKLTNKAAYTFGSRTPWSNQIIKQFVQKTDLDGNKIWFKEIDNKSIYFSPRVTLHDMQTDKNENLFVLAEFYNKVPINGIYAKKELDLEKTSSIKIEDTEIKTNYPLNRKGNGYTEIGKKFILKINPAGKIINTLEFSGENFTISKMIIKDEEIFIFGRYTKNAVIQNKLLKQHPNAIDLVRGGVKNKETRFIAKLNNLAEIQWIKTFVNYNGINDILIKENKVLMIGMSSQVLGGAHIGGLNLIPSNQGATSALAKNINSDIFIATLNKENGNWESIKTIGELKSEILKNSKIINNKLILTGTVGDFIQSSFKLDGFIWEVEI